MEQETDPAKLFEIIEQMGEGSYGSVFKARYRKNNCLVAVKIIASESRDEEIMREIHILKECRSDYIIRYYGSYYKDGNLWIIMEFGDYGSLADSVNKEPNVFSEIEIQHLLASVLLGLDYLHTHKKIHRDIKASNVLLTKEGKAKLADFGVSARLETTLSRHNTVIGTPLWMAPEIIQEASYDTKADIWSLGITAIELAEGKPPYAAMHPMRAVFMIPNRPSPRLKNDGRWSDLFADFIAHCLQKDPDKRASARELLQHPFIRDARIELENNHGSSQVLKALVPRMAKRREEISRKKRLSSDSQNGSPNCGELGTIVERNTTNSTIVKKPVAKPIPLPVIHPPPVRMLHKEEIMRPPAIESDTTSVQGTPLMNIARQQYFERNPTPRASSVHHIPKTHLRLTGNVNTGLTTQQQAVSDLMPPLPHISPAHSDEGIALKRRGEELKKRFLNDFQILFDTYYSEVQRIANEMKSLEK